MRPEIGHGQFIPSSSIQIPFTVSLPPIEDTPEIGELCGGAYGGGGYGGQLSCNENQQCCGNACIDINSKCCNDETGASCPASDDCCGDVCMPEGVDCCDPKTGTYCVPPSGTCCGNDCIPTGAVCCNPKTGTYCLPGSFCLSNGGCCANGLYECPGGKHCCFPVQSCIDGTCIPNVIV